VAARNFIKHHGVSKEHFPLRLKELEFKYDSRSSDILEPVASYLCDLVPKIGLIIASQFKYPKKVEDSVKHTL
jgi:hypothetical protein